MSVHMQADKRSKVSKTPHTLADTLADREGVRLERAPAALASRSPLLRGSRHLPAQVKPETGRREVRPKRRLLPSPPKREHKPSHTTPAPASPANPGTQTRFFLLPPGP